MELTNQKVKHKTFGVGVITARAEQMAAVYREAWAYLKEISPPGVDGEELQKYFTVPHYDTFRDIAKVMFSNLQQRAMATKVIGFDRADRKDRFARILLEYDCKAILKTYTAQTLFETFCEAFDVKNAESKNNLWRVYAKSILAYCKFISRFKTVEDFDLYVRGLEGRELELIERLKKELVGCGFALSCNFLKDIGYVNYPKPDVHIIELFSAFGFCRADDDLDAFHAVREMATVVGDSPFVVDRLFWLIGSGVFYEHDITIGSHKKAFIELIRAKGLA